MVNKVLRGTMFSLGTSLICRPIALNFVLNENDVHIGALFTFYTLFYI